MPTLHSYTRYSRLSQRLGDSERRQLERGRSYAVENGMRWSESYRDEGISAFTGANSKTGDLARLLDDVRMGRVPDGDAFWIENLDRLSRLAPWESIKLFQAIIDAGLPLVVNELGDNDEPIALTRERLIREDHLLDRVYGELRRAHRESKRKSSMLRQNAARKRQEARDGTKPFSGRRCKPWLQLLDAPDPETGLWYKAIEDRKQAIIRAHILAASNIGVSRIADMFEGVVPRFDGRHWKGRHDDRERRRDWHASYVLQLLKDDAVLGWLQPTRLVDGKKVPEPPIKCYPEIVDPVLVAKARAKIAERRNHGGGRRGKNFGNIVTQIGHCTECGGGLWFRSPGARSRRYTLICYNRCGRNPTRFPYSEFEAHLFKLSRSTIASMLEQGPINSALASRIAQLALKIERDRNQQASIARLIVTLEGSARDAIMGEFVNLSSGIDAAEKQLVEFRQQLQTERAQPDQDFRQRFARAMERMQSGDAEEKYVARAMLHQEYRRIIKRLSLYPDGTMGIAIKYGVAAAGVGSTATEADSYVAAGLFEFVLRPGEGVAAMRLIGPDNKVYAVPPTDLERLLDHECPIPADTMSGLWPGSRAA